MPRRVARPSPHRSSASARRTNARAPADASVSRRSSDAARSCQSYQEHMASSTLGAAASKTSPTRSVPPSAVRAASCAMSASEMASSAAAGSGSSAAWSARATSAPGSARVSAASAGAGPPAHAHASGRWSRSTTQASWSR